MAFNPLQERGIPVEKQLRNWSELNTKPYEKGEVDPYTRARIVTMNGIEAESISFSHQFARHLLENNIRRALALTRSVEQQQQKAIHWLVPGDETILETTIAYEQTIIDLTAFLARMETDPYLRQCFELGLLDHVDHLYRFANLLDLLEGKKAEAITGRTTEITPGRPTVEQHRHPCDEIRRPMELGIQSPLSALHVLTLTAVEQQALTFFMTVGNRPMEPLARGLFLEIAQIEEQHLSQYESLLDASLTWFQQEALHHYNECYLYYSFMVQEPNRRIRELFERHLEMELGHLNAAVDLTRRFESREPETFLPKALPEPVALAENRDYIRSVLAAQIDMSARESDLVDRAELPPDHRYHRYQEFANQGMVPSEEVIDIHVDRRGEDYRFEPLGPNPVVRLQRISPEAMDAYEEGHRHGIVDARGELDYEGEEAEPFTPREEPPRQTG